MKTLISILIVLFILATTFLNSTAQQNEITGSVYAFKDLSLNNIRVNASKAKTTVQTDSKGNFRIKCQPGDKLQFLGAGFNTVTVKIKDKKPVKVKMIFKGGTKNEQAAVKYGHVSKEGLEYAISYHADQNYEYFNYTDIFTAISKIYASNDNISVRGNSVYIRKDNTSGSGYPAIFVVDGKLALDIADILPGNIESIELIPDGSASYGPGAANGVVVVKTRDN